MACPRPEVGPGCGGNRVYIAFARYICNNCDIRDIRDKKLAQL
jgi:hypothetical protein